MKIYNLERAQAIDVGFQLGDEVVPIACDLDRAVRDYPRISAELSAAYNALRGSDAATYDERYVRFADVMRTLLDLVFGDNAEKVAAFFDYKWIELLIQIVPCLEEDVVPAIRDYSKAQQEKLLRMARK